MTAIVTAIVLATLAPQAPALEDAVVTGTVAQARAAILNGADVNQRDKDGVTALMRAASAGRGDMVRLLLASAADAHAVTSGGVTALMMASLGGYGDAVRPLLAAKADANVQDKQGRTALMAAATGHDIATVEALLAAGANPALADAGGGSALTYAAAEGFAAAVDALLARGATGRDRELTLAASRCHTSIVRALLDHGMNANGGGTAAPPLVSAAGANCAATVELLIAKGADVNRPNSEGGTALINASAAGHPDVVKVLLANGADVNIEDSLGRTAGMYAATNRHEAIAELFRQPPPAAIVVSSPVLTANAPMPREFTADGRNVSPPLNWSGVPERTRSIAVVCEDPDAGNPPPFVHWVMYNIPPTAQGLAANIPATPNTAMPAPIAGAVQGPSGFRQPIYRGPAPPPGRIHHYHFVVYALDTADLPSGLNRAQLLDAIAGHVLGRGELVVTYERTR